MAFIDKYGYLSRRTSKKVNRRWFIATFHKSKDPEIIPLKILLKNIIVPKRYAGKKLRFKVEVIEDDN